MRRHPLSEKLQDLTQQIISTYELESSSLPKFDFNLRPPSREKITQISDQLFGIFFPGFFGIEHLDGKNVSFHIGALLDELAALFSQQLYRAFQFHCQNKENFCQECADRAEEKTIQFFQKLPEVRKMLLLDVQAAYEGDPAATNLSEVIFSYPGLVAVTIYRVAHELHSLGVPLLPRLMTEYAHSKTGIDIHPGAKIGKYFFIDHGTGVVIGETTEIGEWVRIYQGVTLGGLSIAKDEEGKVVRGTKRHPTICDHVIIYAGATILGGSTVIGEGCIIGGNTWVIRSVPPFTKVINESHSTHIEKNSLG